MRNVLKSKIHRGKVTSTNTDYVGSVFIDKELMKKVDLIQYEKVLICNITNGNRWETYAMKGKKGEIAVQGAGAKICNKGDMVIILAFEISDKKPEPKMILVDESNEFVKYL
ncbi:MAG: aspartate 1-decarboxylase [Candidatus Paceibacterota bacterium]